MFAYIDILKDAYHSIKDNSIDYLEIENKLDALHHAIKPSTIKCIYVGETNTLYQKMVTTILEKLNIQCAFIESGLIALERLIHEHFDILITSRENAEINGTALIAILRLNKRKNCNIQSVLLTSNPKLNTPNELLPNYVVLKDKDFTARLDDALKHICNVL